MKNILSWRHRHLSIVVTLLFSVFLLGGAIQAGAHDDRGDRDGFRDHDGQYHRYGYHHHHRGYWNRDQNGAQLWINI